MDISALNGFYIGTELESCVLLVLTNSDHFYLVPGKIVLDEVHVSDLLTWSFVVDPSVNKCTKEKSRH